MQVGTKVPPAGSAWSFRGRAPNGVVACVFVDEARKLRVISGFAQADNGSVVPAWHVSVARFELDPSMPQGARFSQPSDEEVASVRVDFDMTDATEETRCGCSECQVSTKHLKARHLFLDWSERMTS